MKLRTERGGRDGKGGRKRWDGWLSISAERVGCHPCLTFPPFPRISSVPGHRRPRLFPGVGRAGPRSIYVFTGGGDAVTLPLTSPAAVECRSRARARRRLSFPTTPKRAPPRHAAARARVSSSPARALARPSVCIGGPWKMRKCCM